MARKVFKIVVCIVLAVTACGCREVILRGVKDLEATRIILHLRANSVSAEKSLDSNNGWSIVVDSEKTGVALELLDEANLIPREETKDQESQPLIPSREDQAFRYERRISHEIEETLRQISDVESARVHLNLRSSESLFESPRTSESFTSGSVMLSVGSQYTATDEEVSKLVANASGVRPETISVMRVQKFKRAVGTNTLAIDTSRLGSKQALQIPGKILYVIAGSIVCVMLLAAIVRHRASPNRFSEVGYVES